MRFLIDKSRDEVSRKQTLHPELVRGQLLTPLTRYKNWGGVFAIDNGAYSGLNRDGFFRLLKANEANMSKCLFVAVPDIVGNARRTHELYGMITQEEALKPWTKIWAYVAQDGLEDMHVNWYEIQTLFVGGTDRFKDSSAAYDLVKTAKALDIPVHVGRVNTIKRYRKYAQLGADTCDGSGVAMYDHMLRDIKNGLNQPQPLLECQA